MKFVLLYGRPATGKLTIGRALATATGYPLFHNHLVVDTALAVYPFGSPGFVTLRETLWRAAFDTFVRDTALPGLIFTFNPENSAPQAFVDDLFTRFDAAGHTTHVFELTCPEPEIERRLTVASRHEHHKMTDVALYRRLRAEGAFDTPKITRNRTVIDTATLDPAATAAAIHVQLQ